MGSLAAATPTLLQTPYKQLAHGCLLHCVCMQAWSDQPDKGGNVALLGSLGPSHPPEHTAPRSQATRHAGSHAGLHAGAEVERSSAPATILLPKISTPPSRGHSLPQTMLTHRIAWEPQTPLSGPLRSLGGSNRRSPLPSHLQLGNAPSFVDAPSVLASPGSSMGSRLPSVLRVMARSQTTGCSPEAIGREASSPSLAASQRKSSLKGIGLAQRDPAAAAGRPHDFLRLLHV